MIKKNKKIKKQHSNNGKMDLSGINKKLFANLKVGIIIADSYGIITYCNPAFYKISGLTARSIKNKRLDDLFEIPEQKKSAAKEADSLIASPKNWEGDLLLKRAGNKNKILKSQIYPLPGSSQKPDGFQIVVKESSIKNSGGDLLIELQKRFKTVFDNINDMVFIHGVQGPAKPGKFLEVNKTVIDILGYSEKKIKTLSPFDIVVENKKKTVIDETFEILNKGELLFEKTFLTSKGKKIPVEIHTHAFKLNGKDIIISIARDISERKKMFRELSERETRYRLSVENSPNPIFSVNKQGHILSWNRSCERIFNRKKSELLGMPFTDILAPSKNRLNYIKSCVKSVFGNKSVDGIEITFMLPDGSERITLSRLYPLQINNKVISCVFANSDITDMKKVENELVASERKYRLLFDEMLSAFALHELIVDKNGVAVDYKFLAVNKSFEKFTGLKAKDIIGKRVKEVIPNLDESWIEKYGKVTLTGKPVVFENYVPELDRIYEVHAHRPEKGKFAVIFSDVTERKRNLAKIEHLNQLLSAIRNVNQLIVKQKDKYSLIKEICEILKNIRGYHYAWIALTGSDGNFDTFASAGLEDHSETLRSEIIKNKLAECQIRALKQNSAVICDRSSEHECQCIYSDFSDRSSFMTIRLSHNKTVYGLMSIATSAELLNQGDEIIQFGELADDIGFAIHNIHENERIAYAQDEIQAKEDLLNQMGSIAKIGGWKYDIRNGSITLTDEIYTIFEIKKNNANGESLLLSTFSSASGSDLPKIITEITDKKLSYEWEYEFISQNRKRKWIKAFAKPKIENNKVVFAVGTFQDITETKTKEEELRKLKRAVEQSPAAIVITDYNGYIEYVNPKFTEVSGYTFEEAYQRKPSILKSGETTDEEYALLWRTILGGNEWRGEFHNKKKSGELFWESVSISPIKNEKNETTHFIAIKENVTEYKRIIKELITAKEEAEKTEQLKSEFLAQMSHEIRSPLNVILNFTSLIQNEIQEKLTPEFADSFDSIQIAGRRIIRTIDLILNMAELQTNNYQPMFKPLNLRTDILLPLERQYRINAETHQIRYSFNYLTDKVKILADEYSLGQIFANLIDNAIKYTLSGSVEVIIDLDEQGRLRVKVKDTGVGISSDYLPRLFDPFTQEEQGYGRSYEGNGLGLALVKRYCELNNASITVESRKGSGTVFSVVFE